MILNIQSSYMAGNHEATENEYQFINKTFSFDRKKLDIKSAEYKDTFTGLEKTFLAYIDSKSSEGFPIAGVCIKLLPNSINWIFRNNRISCDYS